MDGFRANLKAAFGNTPETGVHRGYDRSGYNLNMRYAFDGDLKGLSIVNRRSHQDTNEKQHGRDGCQVRLRVEYDFRLL